MYRCERDESHFRPAQRLAWEFVLPYTHLPIIDSDTREADNLSDWLENRFTKEALEAAVSKL